MATFLLDVNVLIALAWPSHLQHTAARRWWNTLAANDRWATCPITQCAFVRISSNLRMASPPLTVEQAFQTLEKFVAHPQHDFWADSISICTPEFTLRPSMQGHQQVTDAYLLNMCLRRGETLVTFDAGIPSLLGRTSSSKALLLLHA